MFTIPLRFILIATDPVSILHVVFIDSFIAFMPVYTV